VYGSVVGPRGGERTGAFPAGALEAGALPAVEAGFFSAAADLGAIVAD